MQAKFLPLRFRSQCVISLLSLLCVCLFLASPAFSQVDQGAITGTVVDSTGAVIASAQVTLTNTDNGLVLRTETDSGGVYTFSPVRTGHYKLSATASGFATTTQENLTLSVQQRLAVTLQLKPGATSENVEVTAAPPLMQTQEGSVGQVIGTRSVNDLPLNGRNFTFLAQLAAGVNSPQADTRGNAATRRLLRQWLAARAEQLHAGRHRQQLRHRGLPQRHELRGSAARRCDSGIQGTDLRLQRRIRPFWRCGAQCHDQVRYQFFPRRGVGILPQ